MEVALGQVSHSSVPCAQRRGNSCTVAPNLLSHLPGLTVLQQCNCPDHAPYTNLEVLQWHAYGGVGLRDPVRPGPRDLRCLLLAALFREGVHSPGHARLAPAAEYEVWEMDSLMGIAQGGG